jgi:hypothetical protein
LEICAFGATPLGGWEAERKKISNHQIFFVFIEQPETFCRCLSGEALYKASPDIFCVCLFNHFK